MKMYTEDDFVKVVDAAGTEQPSVPKSWIGKDLLPEGTKRASSRSTTTARSTTSSPAGGGNEQPAGNASREEWAAYATKVKGATEADLKDADGEDLGRDEIKAKYGS